MFDLDSALHQLVGAGGSDLHLKVPARPMGRVHGDLAPLAGSAALAPEDTERALAHMLGDANKQAEFDAEGEVDFAYTIDGLGRFRVNAFRQRGSISLVARVIPFAVRSVGELGLPASITELAEEERGLILLTGTTGSGKSTTLAAMIDHINRTRSRHIVTIEDPIEYLHPDRTSIVNQREVGMDTGSFSRAMRRVLRQDPDVILIGEMRDEETVRAALSAAETGHLVMSTVHTLDAPESVNRILDFFPPHEQNHARAMLAGTLRGVVSQRLVPTPDGRGRVCVCEILRMTGRAKDMIMDPNQTGRLQEVIAEGGFYGMQTFDQALFDHFVAGRVSHADALRVASSPHDFKLLVAAEGRRGTTMADVADARRGGGAASSNGSGHANGNGEGPSAPATAPGPVAPGAGVSAPAPVGPPPSRPVGAPPRPSAAPPGF